MMRKRSIQNQMFFVKWHGGQTSVLMDRVDFLILKKNLLFWISFQKYHILFLGETQVYFCN